MARPRQVSTEAILEAARAVFLELGPAASTTEIAKRVGLSQAALFKRFGTKSDLMVRALAPPTEPLFMAALHAGPEDAPLAPQLHAIGLSIAQHFSRLVPCMCVLRAAGCDHAQMLALDDIPPPVRAHTALVGWLARALEMGRVRSTVDIGSTALVFLGALRSRAFLAHLLGDAQPLAIADSTYLDHLVEVLCHGIQATEPA
jgi:AcrR family transcriptional regulator